MLAHHAGVSVVSPLSVEPPWVVHELSSRWFLPATQVAERLADLHRVVDGWVTAGTFVLAPPLYLGPADHPVFLALAEHVRARHGDDRPTSFCYWDDVGSLAKVQDLVRLPTATLEAYPVRGRTDLLNEVQRLWGFVHAERDHELQAPWQRTFQREDDRVDEPSVTRGESFRQVDNNMASKCRTGSALLQS